MYELAGFDSTEAHQARRPTWEPPFRFSNTVAAEETAQTWLGSRSAEALVEILQVEAGEGPVVVAVVTRAGTRPG